MKTIKIFLASSEELDYDRMVFGNLVRRLDDMYEKRGIRIKLFEWEDYDAAFNDRRKQDEYNDHVRESDVFLALFYKKAGEFTIEEFDVASEEFKQHASPKVFTFCKDLQPGEEESPELTEFKKRLFGEMGHYWCRYDSRESLQLQFVMQLQLVESNQMGQLKVEDGNVTMDGIRIAPMDKLRFAAANEDYVKMQTEISELHDEIEEMQLNLEKKQQKLEKKKAKLEKDPEDEEYQEEYQEVKEEVDDLVDKLQPKLNKYNKLKEDFREYQKLLFDTAKRVAQLQGERITERMRRAMDAFTEGKVREANIILDEAEADARRNLEDYMHSKEITELKRQAVISSIEELSLKASTLMADTSIPIEERIAQTEQIYAQADEMAKALDYEQKKYNKLMGEYSSFLQRYGKYEKAIEILKRQAIWAETTDKYRPSPKASYYFEIGLLYKEIGNLSMASEYYLKAANILENNLILEDADTGKPIKLESLYESLGNTYSALEDFPKALDYYLKALEKKEKHTSSTLLGLYRSIGWTYYRLGNLPKALEYYYKAVEIKKPLPLIGFCYQDMGLIFDEMGEPSKALGYYFKTLDIFEKDSHLNLCKALLFSNIGSTYCDLSDFSTSLEYYYKSLSIYEKIYPQDHPVIMSVKKRIEELKQKQSEKNHHP